MKLVVGNANQVTRNVNIGGASMKARSRNTSTNVVIAQEAMTLRGIRKCYNRQYYHGTRLGVIDNDASEVQMKMQILDINM